MSVTQNYRHSFDFLNMIPKTFAEWTNCILNDCKINLTKEFAQQRLGVYEDKQLAETQNFISLYGEQHYSNIVNWLKKIIND